MAVPSTITDLSVAEGSNSPLDSDSVTAATRPSDYLRAHAAIIRTLAASTTLAAGATTDLSTVTGTFVTTTGAAVTITALGTIAAGIYKGVIYNAAHTLTHNATSLILLGGANRTVAAGDFSLFLSEGSGNWRELVFSDATGYQPLDADLTAIAALTTTAYGRAFLEVANEAAFKALVNLEIGTDVQAYDATLAALAGVLTAANKIPYATALNTASELDLSTNTSLGTSDTTLSSQKAVKTYVDTQVATKLGADVGVDGVGLMAFLWNKSGSAVASGATVAGSGLRYVIGNTVEVQEGTTAPAGTWRNVTPDSVAHDRASTFQRIS